ncbi:MAG: hypothetical protein U1F57_05245 [bacterium]
MKKKTALMGFVLALCLSVNAVAAPRPEDLKKTIDSVHFKHPWKVQPFFDSYELISTFKAPVPFSMKGEPEANIIIGIPSDKAHLKDVKMAKILEEATQGLRKDLRITEYLETDGKPVDNIVSSVEKIDGEEVGILKFRSLGEKSDPPGMPQSVRQVYFVKDGQLYNLTLLVLFAAHQNDVRADQMELVKALLKAK